MGDYERRKKHNVPAWRVLGARMALQPVLPKSASAELAVRVLSVTDDDVRDALRNGVYSKPPEEMDGVGARAEYNGLVVVLGLLCVQNVWERSLLYIPDVTPAPAPRTWDVIEVHTDEALMAGAADLFIAHGVRPPPHAEVQWVAVDRVSNKLLGASYVSRDVYDTHVDSRVLLAVRDTARELGLGLALGWHTLAAEDADVYQCYPHRMHTWLADYTHLSVYLFLRLGFKPDSHGVRQMWRPSAHRDARAAEKMRLVAEALGVPPDLYSRPG